MADSARSRRVRNDSSRPSRRLMLCAFSCLLQLGRMELNQRIDPSEAILRSAVIDGHTSYLASTSAVISDARSDKAGYWVWTLRVSLKGGIVVQKDRTVARGLNRCTVSRYR